jgi:hypothetical protein
VAGIVDVKVLRAPAPDIVKRARRFYGPWLRGVVFVAHLIRSKLTNYKKPGAESNQHIEKIHPPARRTEAPEGSFFSTSCLCLNRES